MARENVASQGKSREETIESIKEAIALYIETLESENLAVPVDGFEALLVPV